MLPASIQLPATEALNAMMRDQAESLQHDTTLALLRTEAKPFDFSLVKDDLHALEHLSNAMYTMLLKMNHKLAATDGVPDMLGFVTSHWIYATAQYRMVLRRIVAAQTNGKNQSQ